ncbi:MAG TPA: hypothetical protein VMF91_04170 [Bryobacteraceae bacterium]|nr:hypothetical protein [Bryobacteraceae bacterium]
MILNPVPLINLRCPQPFWMGWGWRMVDGAAICLAHHGYADSAMLEIERINFSQDLAGSGETALALQVKLLVVKVNREMANLYRNLATAAEEGAYAVSLGALFVLDFHDACQEGRFKEGFDFLLFAAGAPKARLEVSGMLEGNRAQVMHRLKEKLRQVNRYCWETPAYAAVVEFSRPLLIVGCML